MKVLLSWLRDYIEINETPEKIADALIMAGIEVEEIIQPGKYLKQIVVGQINSVDKHPNADKLTLCSVNIGKAENLQIVCGATNMKAGDKVPVALVGAVLPAGFEISKAKIRGVESSGMLCSKSELGIANDHEGLYILPENFTIGEDIVGALKLDEVVFDVSITPDRGDVLSHLGIARELSAIFNLPLNRDPLDDDSGVENIMDHIKIEILNPELCPRYSARLVKDVQVTTSPDWIANRLQNVGIKPINNVVDVTNYIMLDIGHPMHAFDYDKVKDKTIIVRRATNSETLTTLDEVKRDLNDSMLVIADSEKPLGIAGVMGGLESSITENTKNILLEAATFDPINTRKTARKLQMMSESSYRFERGTNIDNTIIALNEAVRLLKTTADITAIKGINDCYPNRTPLKQIKLRTKRFNKVVGVNLTAPQIETYLLRLKLEARREGEDIIVSIPPYRHDLELEDDLIEEAARMYGYNNIPETLPAITSVLKTPTNLQKLTKRLRDHLISSGVTEIMTYCFIPSNIDSSFNEKKPIALRNPLSEELNVMRTSMKWNMFDAIKRNVLNDEYNLKFFEIGRVFHPTGAGLSEEFHRLSLGFCGAANPLNWKNSTTSEDLFSVKGMIQSIESLVKTPLRYAPSNCTLFHPTQQMEIYANKQLVGQFGKIHPRFLDNKKMPDSIFIAEIDIGIIANLKQKTTKMIPIPKHPPIRRDLSLLVPVGVSHSNIVNIIRKEAGALLEDLHLFDIYEGKNIDKDYKSMSYSMTFRTIEKTLTDLEIQPTIDKIIEKINKDLNVKLR